MAGQWIQGRRYAWTHEGRTDEVILRIPPTRGDFGHRTEGDVEAGEYPGPILTCTVKLVGSRGVRRVLAKDLTFLR